MIDLIVFDLDGTLYDINDVLESVYEIQINYLFERKRLSREKAINLLTCNQIYNTMRDDSKSATEYFDKIGIGGVQWKEYRERHYRIDTIDQRKAVQENTIMQFSRIAPLALVSSNTKKNVLATLRHLHIGETLFQYIISSDDERLQGGFDKTKAYRLLIEITGAVSCVSIGDRYNTDIMPILENHGKGILVTGPSALDRVFQYLSTGGQYMTGEVTDKFRVYR